MGEAALSHTQSDSLPRARQHTTAVVCDTSTSTSLEKVIIGFISSSEFEGTGGSTNRHTTESSSPCAVQISRLHTYAAHSWARRELFDHGGSAGRNGSRRARNIDRATMRFLRCHADNLVPLGNARYCVRYFVALIASGRWTTRDDAGAPEGTEAPPWGGCQSDRQGGFFFAAGVCEAPAYLMKRTSSWKREGRSCGTNHEEGVTFWGVGVIWRPHCENLPRGIRGQ